MILFRQLAKLWLKWGLRIYIRHFIIFLVVLTLLLFHQNPIRRRNMATTKKLLETCQIIYSTRRNFITGTIQCFIFYGVSFCSSNYSLRTDLKLRIFTTIKLSILRHTYNRLSIEFDFKWCTITFITKNCSMTCPENFCTKCTKSNIFRPARSTRV